MQMIDIREIQNRHSIRLRGFDYSSPGYYFITICVQNKELLLGKISEKKVQLNAIGEMVRIKWMQLVQKFNHIVLDRFVIMPNHFHGIIQIKGTLPFNAIHDYFKNHTEIQNNLDPISSFIGTTENSIGRIIQFFKSISTSNFFKLVEENNWPPTEKRLWQRNFYDHIVRDSQELDLLRGYIVDNPLNWTGDEGNPINQGNEREMKGYYTPA